MQGEWLSLQQAKKKSAQLFLTFSLIYRVALCDLTFVIAKRKLPRPTRASLVAF